MYLAKVQHYFSSYNAFLMLSQEKNYCIKLFLECEILQSLMISYRSLLFIAIEINDRLVIKECKPTLLYTDLPNHDIMTINFFMLTNCIKGCDHRWLASPI